MPETLCFYTSHLTFCDVVQKRIDEKEKLAALSEKSIVDIQATISTTTPENKVGDEKPKTTKKINVVTNTSEVKISITTDQINSSSTININNISTTTTEHAIENTKKITEDIKDSTQTVTSKTTETVKDIVNEVPDVKEVEKSIENILGL